MKDPSKGGRPTKLTEEMVDKAEEYLRSVEDERLTIKEGFSKDGDTSWLQTAPKLPNHARLAYMLKVSKQVLYDWSKPHPDDDEPLAALRKRFLDCLDGIKHLQEAMLNENGASGIFNPAVTNRILAAQHGYKERIDETSDDKPLGNTEAVANPEVAKAVSELNEALRKSLTK